MNFHHIENHAIQPFYPAAASRLENNRHLQILKDAARGRYGVVAAIAYNIEQVLGLVEAAEKARSPLIIQFFPMGHHLFQRS